MNNLPPLKIATPCPRQWDELTGDARKRFCGHCQLHVHNLSAMSLAERERFVAASGGQACIAYELRPDGTMVTPKRRPRWLQPFQPYRAAIVAMLAAVVPFILTGRATRRTLGRVAPPPDRGQPSCDGQKHRMVVGTPMPPAANR